MKLLILGATGGTGQHLVTQALNQLHDVTILVRNPSKVSLTHEKLRVVKGDVLDSDILLKVLEGQDAVISSLGKGYSLLSSGLITSAVKILIPAMNAAGVKRLVFLSAFGVGELFSQASFLQKIIFRTFLRSIYGDKAKAEIILRSSTLDWILVCPVALTNTPPTGQYQVGEKLEMTGTPKITRADVAAFMLLQLTDNTYLKKAVVLMS